MKKDYAVYVQHGLVGIVELVDHDEEGAAAQVMDISLLAATDRARVWRVIDKVLFKEHTPDFHAFFPLFPRTKESRAELADLCKAIKRRAKELGIPPWL